jgi:hypothetical protein
MTFLSESVMWVLLILYILTAFYSGLVASEWDYVEDNMGESPEWDLLLLVIIIICSFTLIGAITRIITITRRILWK